MLLVGARLIAHLRALLPDLYCALAVVLVLPTTL